MGGTRAFSPTMIQKVAVLCSSLQLSRHLMLVLMAPTCFTTVLYGDEHSSSFAFFSQKSCGVWSYRYQAELVLDCRALDRETERSVRYSSESVRPLFSRDHGQHLWTPRTRRLLHSSTLLEILYFCSAIQTSGLQHTSSLLSDDGRCLVRMKMQLHDTQTAFPAFAVPEIGHRMYYYIYLYSVHA